MIVVDTNLLVYLLLPGEHTLRAEKIFAIDSQWAAPFLWRSEFRNVLAHYLRRGLLSLDEAGQVMERTEALMRGNEYAVPSASVLALASRSKCSAYDCEFVVLASDLAVSLVTSDREVLSAFPERAVSPEKFRA